MMIEKGTVVAVEPNGIWVETLSQSACNSCAGKRACGQRTLAQLSGSASRLWIVADEPDLSTFKIGDEVCFGIDENIIAKSSLFIYCLPVFTMIAATFIAYRLSLADERVAAMAFFGLIVGGAIVRWYSHHHRLDKRVQPVLVAENSLRRDE